MTTRTLCVTIWSVIPRDRLSLKSPFSHLLSPWKHPATSRWPSRDLWVTIAGVFAMIPRDRLSLKSPFYHLLSPWKHSTTSRWPSRDLWVAVLAMIPMIPRDRLTLKSPFYHLLTSKEHPATSRWPSQDLWVAVFAMIPMIPRDRLTLKSSFYQGPMGGHFCHDTHGTVGKVGNGVRLTPVLIQWYCECENCWKHHLIVVIIFRTLWLVIICVLSQHEPLEAGPGLWGPLGRVPRVLGPIQNQGNGVYHEKIDKTTFNSWSEFPAVFTCCSRPLITSWTSGDNPRPLGVLWEGSQECWVHSRLPQMWFQMRKLLETSSDSCYHFPDTLTGHQLCLITSWTPGGWPDLWGTSGKSPKVVGSSPDPRQWCIPGEN